MRITIAPTNASPTNVRARPMTTDRASAIRRARRSMNEGPFGGGVGSSPVMDVSFNDGASFPRRGVRTRPLRCGAGG